MNTATSTTSPDTTTITHYEVKWQVGTSTGTFGHRNRPTKHTDQATAQKYITSCKNRSAKYPEVTTTYRIVKVESTSTVVHEEHS